VIAPRVRPARRFLDRVLGIGSVEQPIEPGVTVGLQDAFEVL
jgi:hypothetical protein